MVWKVSLVVSLSWCRSSYSFVGQFRGPHKEHQLFFPGLLSLEARLVQGIATVLPRKHPHNRFQGIGDGHIHISNQDLFAFFNDDAFFCLHWDKKKMTAFFLFLISSGVEHLNFHVIQSATHFLSNSHSWGNLHCDCHDCHRDAVKSLRMPMWGTISFRKQDLGPRSS